MKEIPVQCPICAQPASPEVAPFCSARCRDVDLNRWLSGGYRVKTDEKPADTPESGEDI